MSKARLLLLLLALAALGVTVARPSIAEPAPLTGDVYTAFRPSEYGLAFRNPTRDPRRPLLAQIGIEQCGGMAFASLDSYVKGTPPRVTSARALSVQIRSAQSIASNGVRFLLWSMWPDQRRTPLESGVAELTRAEELPNLRAALAKGPVPLGLVRARRAGDVGLNHQVVAYSMTRRGSVVSIGIYDPTQPKADDVTLIVDLGNPNRPISERAGEWEIARWRGFFVERYVPTTELH